jgi:hypothetical protein
MLTAILLLLGVAVGTVLGRWAGIHSSSDERKSLFSLLSLPVQGVLMFLLLLLLKLFFNEDAILDSGIYFLACGVPAWIVTQYAVGMSRHPQVDWTIDV